MSRCGRWALNLFLPLIVGGALWLVPQTVRGHVPAANAYQLLSQAAAARFPYSGTQIVSYTQLPWFELPAAAVTYTGRHLLQVYFTVRDVTHFRVSIETIEPALESGTVTVVVTGRTISAYDSRTNTASRMVMPRSIFTPQPPLLLDLLQGGLVFVPSVGAAQSIRRFLALLRNPGFPLCFLRSARIVRRAQLLGRPVDVIDFGPLYTQSYITGCSFSHPGRCVHHLDRRGWGRVWVDRDHPFILKYVQHGLGGGAHSVWAVYGSLHVRVTALTYGIGPSDLRLKAPVPIVQARNWSILTTGTMVGGFGSLPPGFLPAGTPPGLPRESNISLKQGPLPRTTNADLLFSTGQQARGGYVRSTVGGKLRSIGPYVSGPYLLVQERIRVQGLPAAYLTGAPQTLGKCQVWSGAFADGQRWAAFARGRLSVVVSTNALSSTQLLTYVQQEVCPR